MPHEPTPSNQAERRVVPFPRSAALGAGSRQRLQGAAPRDAGPVADLRRYERGEDDDDYRHRMLVNALALVFVVLLMLAGAWMAERIAALRKSQDCALSGRRSCAPVSVLVRDRL